MAIIALSGNTLGCSLGIGSYENLQNTFLNTKGSCSGLSGAIKSLKVKIDVAAININTSNSQEQIKQADLRESEKKGALSVAYDKLDTLITDVGNVDLKTSSEIRRLKDLFYSRYSYLRPDCEKSDKELRNEKWNQMWQNIKDFCGGVAAAIGNMVKNVGEWLKENWESLVKVYLTVLTVVAVVALCVVTFGGAAVAVAAIVGVAVGVLSQFVSDLAVILVTKQIKFSSWQEYLGSGIGGLVEGVLMLTGNPMLANCVGNGISTYFSGHLTNITNNEKRSSLDIMLNTGFDVLLGAVVTKYGDDILDGVGKKISKIPGLSRLSGQGSYKAAFKMVITKLENKTALKFTMKTISNGIISEFLGNTIENGVNIIKNFFDFEFSKFIKNGVLKSSYGNISDIYGKNEKIKIMMNIGSIPSIVLNSGIISF